MSTIQPIYYSIDRELCTKYFTPISSILLDELPHYGKECTDSALISDEKVNSTLKAVEDTLAAISITNYSGHTVAILTLTVVEVIVLCIMMCVSWCKDRKLRRAEKRRELVDQPGQTGRGPRE